MWNYDADPRLTPWEKLLIIPVPVSHFVGIPAQREASHGSTHFRPIAILYCCSQFFVHHNRQQFQGFLWGLQCLPPPPRGAPVAAPTPISRTGISPSQVTNHGNFPLQPRSPARTTACLKRQSEGEGDGGHPLFIASFRIHPDETGNHSNRDLQHPNRVRISTRFFDHYTRSCSPIQNGDPP